MKKILLVGAIAAMTLGLFLASCEKAEDKACTCTESGDGDGTRDVTPSSYGAKNCSDLELKLTQASVQSGFDSDFTCK